MSEIRDLVGLDMAFAFLREANQIMQKQGHKDLAADISKSMKRVNTIRTRSHRKYGSDDQD